MCALQRDILTSSSLHTPLHLDQAACRQLLTELGPSLALWRAAEVAALREQVYLPPVLDLGCGDGLIMSLVLPAVAVGLDPDRHALEHAASRGIYQRLLPYLLATAPLPASGFATVVSNSVLEHLPQLDNVLATTTRLLQPGGRLIFTTPTEVFGRRLALPLLRYARWRNTRLVHRNLWPLAVWSQRLHQSGMVIAGVRPYLRPRLVRLWDILELLQQSRTVRRQLIGPAWRRLPPPVLDRLAARLAHTDLSAPGTGGGRLIVATRVALYE